jgi:hypothetical protein
MMKTLRVYCIAAALFGITGCAGVDQMGAKLDMAEQHLGSAQKPLYEGQLTSVKRIGAMTSLQFSDGEIMDVIEAPEGLVAGNIVRVYASEFRKGRCSPSLAHVFTGASFT